MITEPIRSLVVDQQGNITRSTASFTLLMGYEPHVNEPFYIDDYRRQVSKKWKQKYSERKASKNEQV